MPGAGADREQRYATNGPSFGLKGVTDFALNHNRTQGSLRAIVGGCTGFIHVDHRLQPGFPQGFLHRFRQAGRQPRANRHDRSAADRYPEQLLQQTDQGNEAVA